MLAIVIPSLNPDANLPDYVAALRSSSSWPIILVDDGSDEAHSPVFDRCVDAASGVEVLKHEVNKGKGRALKTAFAYLLERYPDLEGCVTCDSDGQHLPADVIRCGQALQMQPSALVLGCRDFGKSHVPFRSRFGNNWIRAFFTLATGRRFADTQTGLRAISAEFMRKLLLVKGERFDFESRMLLELGSRTLVQLPIETVYLDGNKSSHFSPLRDSVKILSIVTRRIFANLVRFTAVSLTSFALDISLYALFFHVVFKDMGAGRLAVSVVLARLLSASFNYLANLRFVFDGVAARHSFAKYAILALTLMGASYLFTALALTLSATAARHDVATKAIVDFALFMASFAVQRLFVFSRR